jgi:MinD superfamily P-loop ATPase
VLLVTEPTPFGLHDLRQAYELTRELDVPAGLIINRDGIGNADVDAYCREVGLPILLRIPLERAIGEGIAQGKSLLEIHPEYEAISGRCTTRLPIWRRRRCPMKQLVILSGKGGTGKTSVTAVFAHLLATNNTAIAPCWPTPT